MRAAGRFDPKTPADSTAAFTATVRTFERLVRECPAQWLMFEDVWHDAPAGPVSAVEMVPQPSAMRRSRLALATNGPVQHPGERAGRESGRRSSKLGK